MSIRVLLVLESPDDEEMYTLGLRHLGYEVVSASSPDDALLRARAAIPDIIVVHLGLPGADAFELCGRLRMESELTGIPVIVLTSAVRPDGANRERVFSEPNCAAFVGKPCTPVDLAAIVRQVHGGRRGIALTSGTGADRGGGRAPEDDQARHAGGNDIS